MDELNKFVINNNIMQSNSLINKKELKEAEKVLAFKFGKETAEYLLKYGYLIFNGVELYGINSRQLLDSDMIKQTLYLHKYYPATLNYVALENQGEGDYFLINSEDQVFEFDSEQDKMTQTGKTIFKYIINRFQAVMNK